MPYVCAAWMLLGLRLQLSKKTTENVDHYECHLKMVNFTYVVNDHALEAHSPWNVCVYLAGSGWP